MSFEIWKAFWEGVIKNNPTPVAYCYREETRKIISAANFWPLAMHRRHALRKMGVRKNDFVFSKSAGLDLIVEFLACAIGGFKFVPVSDHIVRILESESGAFTGKLIEKSEVREIKFSLQAAEHFESDIVLMHYTSGSTGTPKPFGLTAAGIIAQIKSHKDFLKIQSDTTRLCLLPQWHAFGFILDVCVGLYAKQNLLFSSEAGTSIKLIQKYLGQEDIKYIALVPRLLELLVKKIPPHLLRELELHVGGAPLRKELLEKSRFLCSRVVEGYGMTECGPGVLMDGIPLGCQVELRNTETGQQLLYVKSDSISPFAELGSDGFFCTQDEARINGDGFEVLGRIGPNIKLSNGRWTTISEIESELVTRPGILSARIVPGGGGCSVKFVSEKECSGMVRSFFESRFSSEVTLHEIVFDDAAQKQLEQAPGKGFEVLFSEPV